MASFKSLNDAEGVCAASASAKISVTNFAVQEEVYLGGTIRVEERQFLAEDPSLPCYETDTMVLELVMLLLVLGIPLAFVCAMHAERHRCTTRIARSQDEARYRRVFGFLTGNYTESSWWWEAVVMLRKALLTAVVVTTAPQGTLLQLQVSALLLVLLLVTQVYRQPYVQGYIQHLDVIADCALRIVHFCNLQ